MTQELTVHLEGVRYLDLVGPDTRCESCGLTVAPCLIETDDAPGRRRSWWETYSPRRVRLSDLEHTPERCREAR